MGEGGNGDGVVKGTSFSYARRITPRILLYGTEFIVSNTVLYTFLIG